MILVSKRTARLEGYACKLLLTRGTSGLSHALLRRTPKEARARTPVVLI